MIDSKTIEVDDLVVNLTSGAKNGDFIGRVRVDSDIDNPVYSILSQSAEGAMVIESSTGRLTVADESQFQHNVNPVITAEVEVSANGESATASVTVNIDNLTEDDLETIAYFKEIALGFEFGNASQITRTWNTDMRISVLGEPSEDNLDELDRIINELNSLIEKDVTISLVTNPNSANYQIYFGSGSGYAAINTNAANLVGNNWGLFFINWDGNNNLNTGSMYVDIFRASPLEQAHLLREELTQSLGLARDSDRYTDSIFQSDFSTKVTEYSERDRELIRLLYHPLMRTGLTAQSVDPVLREIISSR
ncbi:MAG: DUF2927 domain-containing protein [Cyclobacteriaceae bacterium]